MYLNPVELQCTYIRALDTVIPGTAAISRRRQSIKPQVAVKSICDRPAADYDSWRRRR